MKMELPRNINSFDTAAEAISVSFSVPELVFRDSGDIN